MYWMLKCFKKGQTGGVKKKAPYILGVVLCACSDGAPVVLIFNGKWLRFLSKPLELRGRAGGEKKTGGRGEKKASHRVSPTAGQETGGHGV